MRNIVCIRFFLLLISCLFIAPPLTAEQESLRGIVRITGNLYRFQENAHYSVFLVTPEGIIATDPINADTANWLKAELRRRFDKPVKYLIYSHHHEDHVSGGEVFSDTATIIAHGNAVRGIIDKMVPTVLPDITFSDRMTVRLGGKVVELIYAGLSHSDDSVIMHFPEERAVYAVDFVLAKALPYKDLPLSAYFYPEWLDSLHRLEKMDFDILIPGHDSVGTHKDVRDFRHYLEDLESAVIDGIKAGLSIEELQNSIALDEYRDWDLFDDWRALNIEGMYRQLMRKSNQHQDTGSIP